MAMKSLRQLFVFIATNSILIAIVNSEGDRSACNTHNYHIKFNNVQVLDHLVETKISTALTGFSGIGATYIRWGRTSCSNESGTELVYAGRAGGAHFETRGGAANKLCLPEDPDYLNETAGDIASSRIWGSEYKFVEAPHSDLTNFNVPCAVCYVSTRASVLMIPAKTVCPPSWTREYYGYLTAEADSFYRSSFECIDSSPEVIPGSSRHMNGALFFYSGVQCNTGLDCPPYESYRILSCAVCTK